MQKPYCRPRTGSRGGKDREIAASLLLYACREGEAAMVRVSQYICKGEDRVEEMAGDSSKFIL